MVRGGDAGKGKNTLEPLPEPADAVVDVDVTGALGWQASPLGRAVREYVFYGKQLIWVVPRKS